MQSFSFSFRYYFIVKEEEKFLREKFKDDYKNYCAHVLAFLPRIFPYKNSKVVQPPYNLKAGFRSETRSLQAFSGNFLATCYSMANQELIDLGTSNNKLMLITGEVSGDLIGASLIKELKSLNPDLKVTGIGGDRMKSAGMDLIYHTDQMAFLGFVEVVKHLPFIHQVQKKLIDRIKSEKINCVVLIDYPGFNLSIAKKLKPLGVKIIYYVSPQIWAWAKGRVKKVKRLVDKMLVVFPFEVEFYKKENVNVEYVGHPLVERINQYNFLSKDEFFSKFNLDKEKEILLIMPGSRKQEVKEIFPEVIKAAKILADKFNLQVVVARSKNIEEKYFQSE